MFLILLTYIRPLNEIDQAVADHRRFLERHYADGHFLLSGRQEPRTGGVILVKAKSRIEVEELIRQDPFLQEGLAKYEIIEFVPSMAVTGMEKIVG